MVKHKGLVGAVAAVAGAAAAAIVAAGPLNPPAGPVAPTFKTLAEIEPRVAVQSLAGDAEALYVISQPGSYYLTGNVSGVAGKHAIKVAADNVTLDLMGFTLTGPASAQVSAVYFPLVGPNATHSVTVRNGVLRSWLHGVDGTFAINARLERLSTNGNSTGLRLSYGGVISDCLSLNDGNGIDTSGYTVVTRCVVREPLAMGIQCNTEDSVITDCLVLGANNTGIVCGGAGIVRGCTVEGSTFYGIHMTSFGGQVRDCTSYGNGHHGIYLWQGALASGNTCRLNGGAIADGSGIYCASVDNRVEGNNLISNDRGVTTAAAGNLVIHNSASGNTTAYSFIAGTVAGPTVTAATIATSTSPHANYDF